MSTKSVPAQALIDVVQEAMDDWRQQNDPASDQGMTMAEFITRRLDQKKLVAWQNVYAG